MQQLAVGLTSLGAISLSHWHSIASVSTWRDEMLDNGILTFAQPQQGLRTKTTLVMHWHCILIVRGRSAACKIGHLSIS